MLGVSACLLATLIGCGKTDPVKDELYTFVNEDLAAVKTEQNAAINEYNGYFAQEDVDTDALLAALDSSIIPAYEGVLEELNAIETSTDEVGALKTQYVEGATLQLEALRLTKEAIENGNVDALSEASAKIQEAKVAFSDYQSDLRILASEHNLQIQNDTVDETNE